MIAIEYQKIISDLIQKNIEKVAKGIWDLGIDIYSSTKAKEKRTFKEYLEKAITKYSKIKNILYRNEPVYIYDLFVNMDLVFKGKRVNTAKVKDLLGVQQDKLISDQDISKHNHFVLLSGSAGCGKSTIMKHYFLNCLDQEDLIPILVELRHIVSNDFSFINIIYESLTLFDFPLSVELLEKSFKNGKIVFLLDGFDEISPELRSKVAKDISDISDKFTKNYFIISSRPDEHVQYLSKYAVAKVRPLSIEQSNELIKKTKYDEGIKKQFINDLSEKLYDNYKDFASNPLLLLIILMTFEVNAEIPTKRSDFYDEAFSTLYRKHDATKAGYKRILFSGLQYETFKEVLAAFSAISYFKNKISFSTEDIYSYLSNAKKVSNKDFNSDNYLIDLLQAVCVLTQDGLYYTYTHKTFQEYFVAKFIIRLEPSARTRIFEKKAPFNRFETNILITLLHELDEKLTETAFIIPKLRSFKELTNYEQFKKRRVYLNFIQLLDKAIISSPQSFDEFTKFVESICDINGSSFINSIFEIKEEIKEFIEFYEQDGSKFRQQDHDALIAFEKLMLCLKYLENKHKKVEDSIEQILGI